MIYFSGPALVPLVFPLERKASRSLKNNLLAPADRQKLDSTHLGLKVSLHLIIKSGGRLWVDSVPGSGSTFIVDFPKEPSGKY
jgi:signal transduction histidine kinase